MGKRKKNPSTTQKVFLAWHPVQGSMESSEDLPLQKGAFLGCWGSAFLDLWLGLQPWIIKALAIISEWVPQAAAFNQATDWFYKDIHWRLVFQVRDHYKAQASFEGEVLFSIRTWICPSNGKKASPSSLSVVKKCGNTCALCMTGMGRGKVDIIPQHNFPYILGTRISSRRVSSLLCFSIPSFVHIFWRGDPLDEASPNAKRIVFFLWKDTNNYPGSY